MNRVCFVACALLLLSVAAFAAPAPTPTPAPVPDSVIAAILGEAAGGSSCAKPQAAARGGVADLLLKATCTANCVNGGTVTCTGNPSCSAVNGNCSAGLEPGHVTCNGVSTYCTPGCCTTGTMQDKACCRCDYTFDCIDCCRCEGFTLAYCAQHC